MKPILLLFTVFLSLDIIAQPTDSISKITFRYDKGHYSFGDPGKYANAVSLNGLKDKLNGTWITICK